MNSKIKNIASSILSFLLIVTILTLNLPILIHFNCISMDMGTCTCNKVTQEKSCCEKSSEIKLTISNSSHCGCFIDQANNNSDFSDNQIALGNKLNAFEKTFYSISLTYNCDNSSNYDTHIHSPPLISSSPVYISIHSLLI